MRIALTGASGRVGAAFADRALKAGHSLLCLGRHLPVELDGKADFRTLDLAAPQIETAFVEALKGVDTLVHLAAKIDTTPADDDAALEMFRINVLGTRHLIDSLARAGVKHLVMASTANFYDPRQSVVDENSLIRPVTRTLYLSSKIAQDAVARESCQQHGIRCATMRLSSVVGTGSDDLVTMLVGKVARGETVTIPNPNYGADFISMDSVVRGLMIAATLGLEGEFNLSSGKRHTLCEVVAMIGATLDRQPEVDKRCAPNGSDHGFPAVDCNRLRAEGYEPEPLERLIARLAEQFTLDPPMRASGF